MQIIKTKNNPKYLFKLMIGILAFFILLPTISQARTFDPNNIITDYELTNKNSLTKTAIQKFLEREDSVLSRYSQVVENQTMTVAEMIYQISQKHNISPKFLLTTLEKEQGLISKTTATTKQLDWATGYSCYGGGCNEKYQGFYNQVESAGETQNIYTQKASQFNFRVGQTTMSFDGYPVTPQNQATANFYIYTPYVGYSPELGVTAPYGGNRLFWRIWNRYFTNQKFLDGQVIKYGDNFYLIHKDKKRKFVSKELFLIDYNLSDAILVSKKDIDAYPDGVPVKYPNNSIVKSSSNNQVYLITGTTMRPILNDSALALLSDFRIAVTTSEIPTVPSSDLSPYEIGDLITTSSNNPQGKLVKDPSGAIWQLKDGLKNEVDPIVWKNKFESATPENITAVELESYPNGAMVKLKDGTFVMANNSYYLISEGERSKIIDLGIFDRIFGISKKNNALKISTELLEAHGLGYTIDYIDDTIKDPLNSTPTTPTITSNKNYAAKFESMNPEGIMIDSNQSKSVTVEFKNLGTTSWGNDVYMKITDKDSATTSLTALEKINFKESSVSQGQTATFTFTLAAGSKKGLLTQEFGLYYDKNGQAEKITSVSKFVYSKDISSGQTTLQPPTETILNSDFNEGAEIISHDIPVAIRGDWGTIDVVMKIKNNSDTTWLSRRTALELYNLNGYDSPFYDPNDWVRKEVVGVPLNKDYIKPGETAEFKFTLDPLGVKQGLHYLNFQIKLLDKNGIQVSINGKTEWHRLIRVD